MLFDVEFSVGGWSGEAGRGGKRGGGFIQGEGFFIRCLHRGGKLVRSFVGGR